ncbi:ATP-dependent DNA helicase, RecQ family [Emticicia oligotrophica DSM 17448]|uniref:ATP-dependent DNA helicase RecQ n=1 Tax=Emticicia oligotrophica (strain DSM 17448 / CIP 109782 / MTCC 6937 / GPTSA100-15) TaxID=929562 RepID=A0ABN4AMH9_EMTOG|nr:ATP-dependent DNA helicase RecQ [Emticicia oligotrophica]AFK03450.1 ATP-dependent DNA helicase, RecQ family [Emticicia oligotrophica DSM 17448]
MQTPLEILKEYWQYDTFRPLQEDIINSVLAKKDTLALMPTGGGKSICFQVPALAMEGVCIVITPLVALMKDQVEQLRKRGVKAAAIYSGMHRNEIDYTLDNFVYGDFKFLYVSPERLLTEIMQVRTKLMKVCLLVIDEAHCISQWGYDFRPPYLKIPEFRKFTGNAPTIALTATATKEAQQDIIEKLSLKNPQVFQQSFARPNISYSVFCEESKEKKLFEILQKVQGTAIVYVRSRRRTKEISDWLNRNRISTDYYHAGLSTPERFKKQEAWISNQTRVIVATNAFGMGIDKPDVRVVIHLDLPETLEAYYQEAGRGGRDGKKAFAVLLYTRGDLDDVAKQVEQKYPPIENIKRVYQALANYFRLAVGGENFESYDFDFQDFVSTFGLPAHETHNELKVLQDEGLIQLSDAYFSPSKISFTVDNHELYKFQIKTPSYDKFIKTLLRIYGGDLFASYVSISEATIGKYFFGSAAEIEKMLDYLHQVGIITYQKQKTIPQLTFLTARQDAKHLAINVTEIQRRKQRDLEKVAAVVRFVEDRRRCRQQMLQEYFNEFTNYTCGICDNCLKQKKQEWPVPIEVYAKYRQKILDIIPAPVNQIVDYQFFNNKYFVKEVIRKMIENEEIRFTELGIVERVGV